VLFRDSIDSACGDAESATGPFYCPGDQKVYIDLSFYRELKTRFHAPGDFAQAYVIAHEIGHHIQTLLGTMEKVNAARGGARKGSANQLSVMLELQADFLAGVWEGKNEGKVKDKAGATIRARAMSRTVTTRTAGAGNTRSSPARPGCTEVVWVYRPV
jgi:predicted metalloprotease